MGEMINDEERAGGRPGWAWVGLGWESVRGGWVAVHTPRARVPPA